MTSTIGVKKIQFPNGTNSITIDSSGSAAITTANITTAAITTANVTNATATGTINTPSINGGQIGGRRNLIINGGMQVSQRATSATTMTNAYATVDRFKGFSNGGGAFTGEQYSMTASDIASTGQRKALKVLVSTADSSIAAADYYAIQYKFEGDDLQHLKYGTSDAETMTLSFFVKSDTTGTYLLTVDKIANGQTQYLLPQEFTISSADTWEKKTLTISPTAGSTSLITGSAGVIGGGTGHGMSFYFGFAWGTSYHGTNNTWGTGTYGTNASANNFMSTVGNEFFLTGVQLEVGSQATAFEHRSFAEELALCQRYYQVKNGSYHPGNAVGSNKINAGFTFPVSFRATPSTPPNVSVHRSGNQTVTASIDSVVCSGDRSSGSIRFVGHTVSDETAYNVYISGNLELDAEL